MHLNFILFYFLFSTYAKCEYSVLLERYLSIWKRSAKKKKKKKKSTLLVDEIHLCQFKAERNISPLNLLLQSVCEVRLLKTEIYLQTYALHYMAWRVQPSVFSVFTTCMVPRTDICPTQ